MRLFREENYQVIIDPEAKMIPAFKRLVTRDKDRRKLTAAKELAYVYYMNDYRSPFIKYNKDEKTRRVKENVGLDKDWKADKEVLKAEAVYNELSETATVKTLKSILNGLVTSSRAVDVIKDRIDKTLDDVADDTELEIDVDALIDNVTNLITLSSKLPKAIEAIEDLEEKVKAEKSNNSRIKGGGGKGEFEE